MISCRTQSVKEVDICIYGGTSAGVIAAYTAQQSGKSVLLIEPGRHLGGMSSGGLGFTDIGNKYVVQGLALDFYRRLGTHYGKLEQWIFEPSVAETIFKDYIKRAGIEVWYENRLSDVENKETPSPPLHWRIVNIRTILPIEKCGQRYLLTVLTKET